MTQIIYDDVDNDNDEDEQSYINNGIKEFYVK